MARWTSPSFVSFAQGVCHICSKEYTRGYVVVLDPSDRIVHERCGAPNRTPMGHR